MGHMQDEQENNRRVLRQQALAVCEAVLGALRIILDQYPAGSPQHELFINLEGQTLGSLHVLHRTLNADASRYGDAYNLAYLAKDYMRPPTPEEQALLANRNRCQLLRTEVESIAEFLSRIHVNVAQEQFPVPVLHQMIGGGFKALTLKLGIPVVNDRVYKWLGNTVHGIIGSA